MCPFRSHNSASSPWDESAAEASTLEADGTEADTATATSAPPHSPAAKLAAVATDLDLHPNLVSDLMADLAGQLWLAMPREAVQKVRKRQLRAMGLIHALSMGPATGAVALPGTSTSTSSLAHLEVVEKLFVSSKGVEARAEALRCLGRALGQVVLQQENLAVATATSAAAAQLPEQLLRAIRQFAAAVSEASEAQQPDDIRLAAADALAASQLLMLRPAGASLVLVPDLVSACLSCWLVMLRLTEDEDLLVSVSLKVCCAALCAVRCVLCCAVCAVCAVVHCAVYTVLRFIVMFVSGKAG